MAPTRPSPGTSRSDAYPETAERQPVRQCPRQCEGPSEIARVAVAVAAADSRGHSLRPTTTWCWTYPLPPQQQSPCAAR